MVSASASQGHVVTDWEGGAPPGTALSLGLQLFRMVGPGCRAINGEL